MKKHTSSRIAAALGVVALSVVAIAGGTTAAVAAPAGYGNIDFSETGSLTVHKYLHQAAGGSTGDISAAPAPGDFTDPVEGVVFTVYPLLKNAAPLDLTVPATWDSLNSIVPGAACAAPAGYTRGTGIPMPATDADGLSTQSLALGVYQVCETFAPSNIVDRALPFILTVPMPHANGWVYDVHAYPKNGEGELVKSVTAQGSDTGMGATLDFPVTMTIPTQANPWTMFAISDLFDTRLAPVGTGVASVKVDGVALDAGYYTVSPVVGNKVTLSFTAAGLTWLNATPANSQAGKVIEVVFQAKVIAIGNGAIQNDAKFQNDPSSELTSNTVTTNWGSVEILKRASGTTGTTGRLQGAVFEVYNAVAPYATDCTKAVADVAAGPITIGAASTFTSTSAGVIAIPGLFVSDSVNPAVNAAKRCYVLKETAAPAGYVLPAAPYTGISVKAGQTVVADAFNADVTNTQQEVPELPLTGANGQLLLLSAGGAAALIAVGLVLVNRRRARVND
ncbi:hypothetical protein ASD65_14500 [Microbacterium sp. Root61]|uniref:SpaH/EbpB family LPXTG-anchored major pilin n=1 Tax=Microbacterium sp. Root61 TaxID=1736570 RepID=UPI0007016355|nr:SpaH/EbpB family LPXTG-anchored major pilin [Microbacterium sp. Root61]KRA25492.1 hypothetical protein ASD65_14500 [Microbacterium sp. Root61]